MSKDRKHQDKDPKVYEPAGEATDNMAAPEVEDVLDSEDAQEDVAASAMAENVKLQEELTDARAQIEKDRNDYLLLMADFDNFRKRVLKEKADLMKNAAERVLLGLLPIVDDFERGLAAASAEDSGAMRQGMELIYNKLVKYLEANGVKAMDTDGAKFDPDFHDAIATIPAPDDDLKGHVLDTTQKGYMLNDKVLRHAKVAVGE